MKSHALLYQLNTSVVLGEMATDLGRAPTLDDLTDAYLDELAARGFDVLWPLGVWRTSAASRRVSLLNRALREEAAIALPDVSDADIVGSPFAICGYEVRPTWGGNAALQRLRARLAKRAIALWLDFVPNHTGLDHPWIDEHPEYYVHGSESDLDREPQNYVRVASRGKEIILAHGRDPFFPGWPDTLQLDYRHAGLRAAVRAQLAHVATLCDGVRCDMAMLLQPDVFMRTWHDRPGPVDGSEPVYAPFWREAIAAVRERHPGFVFVAEVYWGREWELQDEGFDYTYDKELLDRLRLGPGHYVRDHLTAELGRQARAVRFLENHDEPRAAGSLPSDVHRAAAVLAFMVPGLRFFHEGQLEGRHGHVSMHVGRRPKEATDPEILRFYARLLAILRRPELHEGEWQLWECRAAWPDNPSHRDILVMSWCLEERRLLVTVNYSRARSQCYVRVDFPDLAGRTVTLPDLMSDALFEREGDALRSEGLFLDMKPWQYHVFELRT